MKVTYGAIVQSASGRFGGTVHSNWKGIQVVRRFAKPSNPNSNGQQAVRNAFRNLSLSYILQSPYLRAAWVAFATGKPFISRNAWIKSNVADLASSGASADLTPTPGDASTLAPVTVAPVGGVGVIDTTITTPSLPTGWTIARCVTVAVPVSDSWFDDAFDADEATWYEADDATDPYIPQIAALAAQDYDVWGFIVWVAPDAGLRYSASVYGGPVTVT